MVAGCCFGVHAKRRFRAGPSAGVLLVADPFIKHGDPTMHMYSAIVRLPRLVHIQYGFSVTGVQGVRGPRFGGRGGRGAGDFEIQGLLLSLGRAL